MKDSSRFLIEITKFNILTVLIAGSRKMSDGEDLTQKCPMIVNIVGHKMEKRDIVTNSSTMSPKQNGGLMRED